MEKNIVIIERVPDENCRSKTLPRCTVGNPSYYSQLQNDAS